jgi:proline racemase
VSSTHGIDRQALQNVTCVEYHTAGEPFRIVTSPMLSLPGASVSERRLTAINDPGVNVIRRLLCHEPRGHADMYGCFQVPPDDDGARLGVLFWHKDGFSTACGHGTIALGVWATESGLVHTEPDGETEIPIDVPSGRVTARVQRVGGSIRSVIFRNIASYVLARDLDVPTSRGTAHATLAFGGAIYATVAAGDLGLSVLPDQLGALIATGREIKRHIESRGLAIHPKDSRLSGLYGTIFYSDVGQDAGRLHQRNITIFADGEVDRSPCGSGTAARIAQLVDEGRLAPGDELLHSSVIGTQFTARAVERTEVAGIPAVIPEVEGMAYRTGEHRFVLDPDDPLGPGFVLR